MRTRSLFATLAVVGIVASACSSAATPSPAPATAAPATACTGRDRVRRGEPVGPGEPGRSEPADLGRRRRGRAEHHRLGRLRPGRLGREEVRLGPPVRDGDRLQGQRQAGRHLGRDGHAHAPGRRHRLRRRVGLGRRLEPAHRQRRRRTDQPRPDPGLEGHRAVPPVAGPQHGQRRPLRRVARMGRQPAHVPDRPVQPGPDELGRRCSTRPRPPPTRARSPTTTARSTSPMPRSTSRPTSPTSASPTSTS